VAGLDFRFTLHASDASRVRDLLGPLADSILRYVGCAATSTGGVSDELSRIVASAGAGGCEVQFCAAHGELRIEISTADGCVSHLRCSVE
jgi:hypothetical protein